jgi:hypothetical protein
VPAPSRPVKTDQPDRLTRDPLHLRVEVRQPESIQFKQTLVPDMAAGRRGPEEPRIVALASMRRDVSNRQSMHQPQTVDRAQGGGHRAAISAHVVRFDVQRLPAGHIPSVHPPRHIDEKRHGRAK